jgi:hypothetical protein
MPCYSLGDAASSEALFFGHVIRELDYDLLCGNDPENRYVCQFPGSIGFLDSTKPCQ